METKQGQRTTILGVVCTWTEEDWLKGINGVVMVEMNIEEGKGGVVRWVGG